MYTKFFFFYFFSLFYPESQFSIQRKTSRLFSTEKEIPHIRLDDENSLDTIYSREHKLGQGTFGIVYKGKHSSTGDEVAIKIINREKVSPLLKSVYFEIVLLRQAGSANIKLLEREIGILKSVSHDNVIELKEVYETQNVSISLLMKSVTI